MSRIVNEQPVRFLNELGDVMVQVAREEARDERTDHEESMHVPPKRRDPLQAIPFPDERIPDVILSKMIERMQTEGCDLRQVARDWGYPLALVERCMADYQPQWRKFLLMRSSL